MVNRNTATNTSVINLNNDVYIMNVHVQVHSSDCLLCHIKGSAFEESNLDFKTFGYKDLSNKCRVIVTVYARSVNREITNQAIVVVYIML